MVYVKFEYELEADGKGFFIVKTKTKKEATKLIENKETVDLNQLKEFADIVYDYGSKLHVTDATIVDENYLNSLERNKILTSIYSKINKLSNDELIKLDKFIDDLMY